MRRTKEFLESHLSSRILLTDIARAVGASPAYLTDLFARVEGVPLHQYLTQLRLARALVELPYATDLTALALDLGFSSHSHFSYAFRRAFGCTPSRFREMTGAGRSSPAFRQLSQVPQASQSTVSPK
jgi:AraC-like DNA-binding protein